MLPPQEIQLAILAIARANLGAAPEELVLGAAKALGFKNIGAQLRDTLRAHVSALETDGSLRREGDLLVERQGASASNVSAVA